MTARLPLRPTSSMYWSNLSSALYSTTTFFVSSVCSRPQRHGPTYLLQSRIMQTSLLFQIEFFLTSILIFPGKVKPSGRISRPKRRKHSIFVFIEKHSSKILRDDAAGNGCKIHAHGVRLQSRFTEILNPFYTLANFFVFPIDILCTWTVISYGTDCDRAVAQHRVCGL